LNKTKINRYFTALDENGSEYKVIEWQELIGAGTLANPNHYVEGILIFRLASGAFLNRKSEGKYEVVSDGTLIYERG
jgi:hypothetical protein